MNNQETSKNAISGNGQRIYLASPYTHRDEKVMTFRYKEALKATARLINKGCLVFSPIVHCHPIAIAHTLPRDCEFWQAFDTSFLLHWAEAVNVLCLHNWKESTGIRAELLIAQEAKLPIHYIII